MAYLYLYKPLEQDDTFTGNKVCVTRFAYDIEHKEILDNIGSFSFNISTKNRMSEYLKDEYIISIDNKYWGIVRTIKQSESNSSLINITGDDLKGYSSQRITLYPGDDIDIGLKGYDALSDVSTETLVKYFVKNNMIHPTNPCRKIHCLINAPDLERGIQDDRYMSRLEKMDELLNKNCNNAKLGYSITPDLKDNVFVFDIIQGKNRTVNNTDLSELKRGQRVIFDTKYKNILSLEYYLSGAPYKNIFYATTGNDVESPTYMFYRDIEPSEPEGTSRYEQQLNISSNIDDPDTYEIAKQYALKDASEYEKTETITVIPNNDKYVYGEDYSIGDFVTLQAKKGIFKRRVATIDAQITSVTRKWKSAGISYELGFGKGKVNIFDLIKKMIKNKWR